MYVPEHFKMTEAQIAEVLGGAPAGDLVTRTTEGLAATFVPMVADGAGSLIGHLARVNDQWRHPGEALFIVHGPDHYVAADWLSTVENDAVPTWNYVTVQVQGQLLAHDDPEWTLAALRRLENSHADYSLDGLTVDQQQRMLRAIVGIELRIETMVGKAKMSQNKSPQVVTQVIDGLHGTNGEPAADWMREHSLPRAQAKAEQLSQLRNATKSRNLQ